MKITQLASFRAELPVFDREYVMSRDRVVHTLVSTVVRATAEDGTVGYGEACTLGANYLDGFPSSVLATIEHLAPFVIGCNAFEADVVVDLMDRELLGHLAGKAAIDNALWDLRGKLLGQPVARLLGGVQQTSWATFTAIGLGEPEAMADKARRYADHGFRNWQLKLGDSPKVDAARVHAVVEALPPDSAFVTCDANAGWTVAQALQFVSAIDGVETYLEQPCRTIAEIGRVRQQLTIPMLVDESVKTPGDMLIVTGLGIADAVNLKPTRVGGLTKAAKIRDICAAAGVMVLVDEPMGADLATGAVTQLAASIAPEYFISASYFSHGGMARYRPRGREAVAPEIRDGVVYWNDAPGLGVEIDEVRLGEPIAVYTATDRSG